jgi:hypothetical protein
MKRCERGRRPERFSRPPPQHLASVMPDRLQPMAVTLLFMTVLSMPLNI